MNQQRPSLFLRIRVYAHRNPRGYAIRAGLAGGLFFGAFTGLFWAFFLQSVGDSAVWALPFGAVSGALFGVFMAVVIVRSLPSTPLPPGTDRAGMREAARLVRGGVPGADPLVNQIARHQAEAVLRQQYWPKTMSAIFGMGLATNLWAVTDSTTGLGFWGNVVGIVVFSFMLFVAMPLTARQRRRARAFLAALEEDPDPRPDA
ncbi:sensor domain-containing protein [Nocardiopsis dassonvillei]|uniref:sensor domain-containing protein n=1 Tax=Nocardiopsis dassonvillei TaxID=2014 RepID=UPI00157D5657|nr:sensor domain-containing protein [Nocardiopsis dassonvillei]